MRIISQLLILNIKFYKYFIECLEVHGPIKGSYLGFKRMAKCHPVKILGGSSGIDLVPKKENLRKKY